MSKNKWPQLILTKGVKEYRQTVSENVNSSDTVLEIGFAWGTTTSLISKYCEKVVGIDKGESYYKAVKDYPELEFYKIDAFDIKKVIELGYDFNKVYIDVSGCRAKSDIIILIHMYENAFDLDLQVVKCTSLKRFVSRCKVWRDRDVSLL